MEDNLKLLLFLVIVSTIISLVIALIIGKKIINMKVKLLISLFLISIILATSGLYLNFIATNSNGNLMPVSSINKSELSDDGRHQLADDNISHKELTDIIRIKYISIPGMYSIGDILAMFGAIIFFTILFSIIFQLPGEYKRNKKQHHE